MAAVSQSARVAQPGDERAKGLLDAPSGLEWYQARGAALAENFIRDDLPRTAETVDVAALAASGADIRFASGSESHPVFREIVDELTRLRRGPETAGPIRPAGVNGADLVNGAGLVTGAGHVAYFTPEPVAEYIRRQCAKGQCAQAQSAQGQSAAGGM
jgi:hypothetical protein